MRNKKYSSDLSTKSWQHIEKLITVQRTSKWAVKDIVDGILYLTKNGCVWRDLPCCFPPWQTVYGYFSKWVTDGIWKNISDCLTFDYRDKVGKEVQPTVGVIDSQSVKNSPTATERTGFDGGKKVKGRKRCFLVDTLGNLLDSFVVPANYYDGTTALSYWGKLSMDNILWQEIQYIYADGTFGGQFKEGMDKQYEIAVVIPKAPIAQKGNISIHEKRWIVERTIAWTRNNRRCVKDYERNTENANAFLTIANIRRVVKKI
ncbi:MAG: IS5 family transposase [Bacteroidota bacterium]